MSVPANFFCHIRFWYGIKSGYLPVCPISHGTCFLSGFDLSATTLDTLCLSFVKSFCVSSVIASHGVICAILGRMGHKYRGPHIRE